MTALDLEALDFRVDLECEVPSHQGWGRHPAFVHVASPGCPRCREPRSIPLLVCRLGFDELLAYPDPWTHPCGYSKPRAWWLGTVVHVDRAPILTVCPCGATYSCLEGHQPVLRHSWLSAHLHHHWRTP